jgi:hypothetical protein
MGYRLLVGTVIAVHFAFVGYVVLGGLLAIRWPGLFWPHLAAALWGLLGIITPTPCPLTGAENWARRRSGERPLAHGFIDTYLKGVLFPARYTDAVWAVVAVVVLGSWLLAYRHWIHRT